MTAAGSAGGVRAGRFGPDGVAAGGRARRRRAWALAAINTARAAARAKAWRLAGEHAPDAGVDARHPLVLDVDATLVSAHSDKEGAAPTFKRRYGHHPLWAFVDHGRHGTGEPLAVVLRPGNAGSVRHEVARGELVASIGGRLMSTM